MRDTKEIHSKELEPGHKRMKMVLRFVTIFLFSTAIETYGFLFVQFLVAKIPAVYGAIVYVVYAALTCAIWISIFYFRKINWEGINHFVRDPLITLGMGIIISKVAIFILLLADDFRRVVIVSINWIGNWQHPTDRSTIIIFIAAGLALMILLRFFYGMTKRYQFQIVNVKLKLKNLPPAFNQFRIVQVSDIHTGSFDSHAAMAKGIKKALAQDPDIILFTGDLINNRASEVSEKYLEALSNLKAPFGVFSILGNHDYGDYVTWENPAAKTKNLEQLALLQRSMGWTLLRNEHVSIEKEGDKIILIGVENWSALSTFKHYGDLGKACAGLSDRTEQTKVLMSHDPSHWEAEVLNNPLNIDLTLSGHTHGMQLGIENKSFKWSPIQYFYKEWAGLYQRNGKFLYVNRGFGFLTYPGRIGILPEITVIDLY